MNARGQALVVGLHAILGLAVLIAATILTALHDPINAELGSIFGVILGLAGGGAAAVSALGAAINGKTAVPAAMIADLIAQSRSATDHLAGARVQVDEAALRDAALPPPATAV